MMRPAGNTVWACRLFIVVVLGVAGCARTQGLSPEKPLRLQPSQAETAAPKHQPPDHPPNTPSPEPIPVAAPYAHEVKRQGETLFSIASWYTGSGSNWPLLVDANPNLQPKKIHVGDTIRIPVALLKKRKPMPEGYLKSKSPKKKSVAARRSPVSPEPEAEPLYGPIGNDAPNTRERTGLPVPLETIE